MKPRADDHHAREVGSHDAGTGSARPVLRLDPARYQDQFAGSDISEADQIALLEVLWSIMITFVDLGFDVRKVGTCLPEIFERHGADSQNMIQNKDCTRPIKKEEEQE